MNNKIVEMELGESNYDLSGSQISGFIIELMKMSKKPVVDDRLSQILDNFMKKFTENDEYMENGVCNLNFAEAALFLQNCGDVYGKKVDALWDIIFDYQKRLLLLEDKNGSKEEELERVEERKRKYKRKKTNNLKQITKLVDEFSFGKGGENVDYLNQHFESVDLTANWSKFNSSQQIDLKGYTCRKHVTFQPEVQIYTEENDYLGRYNQFHSTTLIEDLIHLAEEKLLTDDFNCLANMKIDCQLISDFLHENQIPCTKPMDSHWNELNVFIKDRMEKFEEIQKTTTYDNYEQFCRPSSVLLTRLPEDLLIETLRRNSLADSLLDDDHHSTTCPSPCNSLVNETLTNHSLEPMKVLETRSKSCSQDSAFFEDDDLPDEDANLDTTNNICTVEVHRDANENIISEPQHSEIQTLDNIVKKPLTKSPRKIESSIETTRVTRAKKQINWSAILAGQSDEVCAPVKPQRNRRLSKAMIMKLATGISVGNQEFENFCRQRYTAADGEGTVPPLSDSESESEDETSDEEMLDEPEPLVHDDESDNHEDNEFFDTPQSPLRSVSTTAIIPYFTSTPHTSRFSGFFEQDPDENDVTWRSVNEWRSFIAPKLKSLDSRTDFDIRDYGSKIIDPSQIGEERYFKSLVKGKSSYEVARYFAATLHLANSYNVEISGSSSGQVANEAFVIKTLDKTRYHDLLNDYQAPSVGPPPTKKARLKIRF